MFSKLIAVALISVVVAQHHTASQFPAGVDPSKCPGFPICDNAFLHNQQPASPKSSDASWNPHPQAQWEQPQQSHYNPQPQPQWNAQPQPQWNTQTQHQPQWNAQPQPQWNQPQQPTYQAPSNHLQSEEIFGPGGDKFPAGVDPKSCPNYPYCDGGVESHAPVAAPPLQGYNERQYPAGVSAHSCPNFPYCS